MLKNTLIVPETDARLAAQMVQDAIDALDVILMFVFGKGPKAYQTVKWADLLCSKTRVSETVNSRRVVWIRDPKPASLRKILDRIFGDQPIPHAAVLNFHDELRKTIAEDEAIDPIKLEKLFLEGHKV